MKFWLDAQLPPSFALWLSSCFSVDVNAVRDHGLGQAEDLDIFNAARQENSIIITKDKDFIDLLDRRCPPPKIIWIICGNTSNARLQEIFTVQFQSVLNLLDSGEILVELCDGI